MNECWVALYPDATQTWDEVKDDLGNEQVGQCYLVHAAAWNEYVEKHVHAYEEAMEHMKNNSPALAKLIQPVLDTYTKMMKPIDQSMVKEQLDDMYKNMEEMMAPKKKARMMVGDTLFEAAIDDVQKDD